MIVLQHVQKLVENRADLQLTAVTVNPGEIVLLVGLGARHRNALVDLLTGQTVPTAGTVRLAGIDPAYQRRDFAQHVGFLPLENGLYPKLTVWQNITFYCDLYGLPHAHGRQLLQQVGLQDQIHSRVEKLAANLARRLAFGRAILHNPQLLLLVEPFNECDQASIEMISRLITEWAAQNRAVLILSNDPMPIRPWASRILEVENGRLLGELAPAETNPPLPFKIPARLEDKVMLVNPADILYATVEDGRTLLCTPHGRIPTHLTLSEVEERLARSGFFRAHRSYLVNVQHIAEVVAYTRNSYTLILTNGADNGRVEIPLSKTAARELRELMGY